MKKALLVAKLSVITALFGFVFTVAPASGVASAAPSVASTASSKQAICDGAGLSAGECSGTTPNGLNRVVKAVLQVLAAIVGVAAVIMIIISGFRYITSGGDANKVGAAKNALIYAIVGLVIVALAEVIVRFVVGKTT